MIHYIWTYLSYKAQAIVEFTSLITTMALMADWENHEYVLIFFKRNYELNGHEYLFTVKFYIYHQFSAI